MVRGNGAFCVALIGLLFSFGCASARRSEPLAGPMEITSSQMEHGRELFMKHCNQCHPKGEAGLGPALNNKPLPGFMIKFQVRHGFGAMPAFSDRQIPDEDLDQLVIYLKALRKQGA